MSYVIVSHSAKYKFLIFNTAKRIAHFKIVKNIDTDAVMFSDEPASIIRDSKRV